MLRACVMSTTPILLTLTLDKTFFFQLENADSLLISHENRYCGYSEASRIRKVKPV